MARSIPSSATSPLSNALGLPLFSARWISTRPCAGSDSQTDPVIAAVLRSRPRAFSVSGPAARRRCRFRSCSRSPPTCFTATPCSTSSATSCAPPLSKSPNYSGNHPPRIDPNSLPGYQPPTIRSRLTLPHRSKARRAGGSSSSPSPEQPSEKPEDCYGDVRMATAQPEPAGANDVKHAADDDPLDLSVAGPTRHHMTQPMRISARRIIGRSCRSCCRPGAIGNRCGRLCLRRSCRWWPAASGSGSPSRPAPQIPVDRYQAPPTRSIAGLAGFFTLIHPFDRPER